MQKNETFKIITDDKAGYSRPIDRPHVPEIRMCYSFYWYWLDDVWVTAVLFLRFEETQSI